MKHNRPNFSRRGLLKSSALGISVAVLGGPLVRCGSAATTKANSKVNLAVVGCGGQGRSDMSELLSVARPVALCDRMQSDRKPPSRLRAAAWTRREDYRKLLDEASATTPSDRHARSLARALCPGLHEAGKHVY
jgi:hypothetical protein